VVWDIHLEDSWLLSVELLHSLPLPRLMTQIGLCRLGRGVHLTWLVMLPCRAWMKKQVALASIVGLPLTSPLGQRQRFRFLVDSYEIPPTGC